MVWDDESDGYACAIDNVIEYLNKLLKAGPVGPPDEIVERIIADLRAGKESQ